LLVAQVAASYFATSHVTVGEIGEVIGMIAAGLQAVAGAAASDAPAAEAQRTTAAQVRKSITPEALISFEDGRPYKTLARHLRARGLTPEQYREKWGLPRDYPMVAEAYSATRSGLAKRMHLAQFGVRARKARAAAKP
jgi:predicted transcriptional regulator